MTKTIDSPAGRLVGWSVVGWSLMPARALTFELVNFGSPSPTGQNIAKITFVRPVRTSIEGFNRQPEVGISVTSIRLLRESDENTTFELNVSGNGRAVIDALEIQVAFY